ncbi:MAG TPA: hypothetical protein VMO47_19035 [Rhodothermales bacterium]|nr:hypothetical protein [Rhodothermales bacterium]
MRFSAVPSISSVFYPKGSQQVSKTVATAIADAYGVRAEEVASDPGTGLRVSLAADGWQSTPSGVTKDAWVAARIDGSGNGTLASSTPAFLYTLASWLETGDITADKLAAGLVVEPAFSFQRPVFDYVTAQSMRHTRRFDPDAYARRLAEAGFTHFEVNGLSTPFAVEPGIPHEYYAQFYTYCAGLHHFVDSELLHGYYPHEYLAANLNNLKKLAAIGRKYGLKPGILCFEPRSLPERVFDHYPTLRGARVDHPFRSHLPRYCLAQDHPITHKHYGELIRNMMDAVPDLAYMSVYTNDSGAGFEHTASLYVGRNGGPYLIREWRSHDKIAQAAAYSATRLMRSWQEAAAEVNPDFEVILRIEPFKVEHDHLLEGFGDGLTVEAPSMLVRGYHLPYSHPRYPEQESAAGTIYQASVDNSEVEKLEDFRAKGFEPKLTYSAGPGFNIEPLNGIPFPRMLHNKLESMRDKGFRHISALGGLLNAPEAPYWPNPEAIRAIQINSDASLDDVLLAAASRWAGDEHAADLVSCWDAVEEAISYFPIVPLFSGFGFCWLRTWVRPFVPNLEAVPKEDRLPFERFMVSTPNNPSINDLGSDVLFELITAKSGRSMMELFDKNALPRINKALDLIDGLAAESSGKAKEVFDDLSQRIRALRVWATTVRNVCAWVACVHGYLQSDDDSEKTRLKDELQQMIDLDLKNTQDLIDLWNSATVEFMHVSDVVETSTLYGENLPELLQRKIDLTQQYRDVEPFIDKEILWRLA